MSVVRLMISHSPYLQFGRDFAAGRTLSAGSRIPSEGRRQPCITLKLESRGGVVNNVIGSEYGRWLIRFSPLVKSSGLRGEMMSPKFSEHQGT